MKYKEIETLDYLSSENFFTNYVGKKAVRIKGLASNFTAIQKWDQNYLKKIGKQKYAPIKVGDPKNKQYIKLAFEDYIDYVYTEYLYSLSADQRPTYYLHDVPLLKLIPDLKADLEPFSQEYLTKWYAEEWWNFVLFFFGKAGSITPMHFDILGGHNLFYHLAGQKKFVIISEENRQYCYIQNYNRSLINPNEEIDREKYPLFQFAEPQECILEPGDVLYMPPYTLHHVTSITNCISMNIDWHTEKSVINALKQNIKDKKLKIFWLNLLSMLGVVYNVPRKLIYPFYKKYFKLL